MINPAGLAKLILSPTLPYIAGVTAGGLVETEIKNEWIKTAGKIIQLAACGLVFATVGIIFQKPFLGILAASLLPSAILTAPLKKFAEVNNLPRVKKILESIEAVMMISVKVTLATVTGLGAIASLYCSYPLFTAYSIATLVQLYCLKKAISPYFKSQATSSLDPKRLIPAK